MKAYSGLAGYAFVSYSHKDKQKVEQILDKLSLAGTRIWYDEGIEPSNDYINVIADKIKGCSFFIAFVSASSLASQYCADEIRYAYEEKKTIMVVKLDESELPAGMKMILNRFQSYTVRDAEKADTTSNKLLPSIPSQVKEQKGVLLYTDLHFYYYLQALGRAEYGDCGYKIVAYSIHSENSFTLLKKNLPYGSEYDFRYTAPSMYRKGTDLVLDVTWDFTFARSLPKDDYFMTRFAYAVSSKDEDTAPEIYEQLLYRESYTTGEKIFYNHVEGQSTFVDKDGTKTVGYASLSDSLRLDYSKDW